MIRDTYADYPRSVNELRSARSGSAVDWSPREILIALLREIDAGRLCPDALVVAFRQRQEGSNLVDFMAACPDSTTMLGLLESAKLMMWRVRSR